MLFRSVRQTTGDIEKMLQAGDGFLSLKLDGLTVELDYKNGETQKRLQGETVLWVR